MVQPQSLLLLLFLIISIQCIPQQIPPYQTGYFTQRLDHFDFSNSVTFPQRYFVCDLYVNKHSSSKLGIYNNLIHVDSLVPIIAYPGNEGNLEDFYENTGLVFELAKHYGALVVFIEHRFYGKTIPQNQDPQRYLTIEQATNDFAFFLTENFGLDELRKNPIILVGGSYGGMLAAWMRFKYPHLVDGAIASSAPILFFNNITPPYLDAQIATEAYRNLTNFQIYPKMTCDSAVKRGFSFLSKYFESPSKDQLQMLSSKFKLCKVLQSNFDVRALASYIVNSFEVLAQANYPYPSYFFGDLPAWPVNGLCTTIAKRLANSVNLESEDLYLEFC